MGLRKNLDEWDALLTHTESPAPWGPPSLHTRLPDLPERPGCGGSSRPCSAPKGLPGVRGATAAPAPSPPPPPRRTAAASGVRSARTAPGKSAPWPARASPRLPAPRSLPLRSASGSDRPPQEERGRRAAARRGGPRGFGVRPAVSKPWREEGVSAHPAPGASLTPKPSFPLFVLSSFPSQPPFLTEPPLDT